MRTTDRMVLAAAAAVGHTMHPEDVRKMVEAAQSGIIDDSEFVHDERFNLDVPTSCSGVPDELLNPRSTWADKDAYDATAEKLAQMFVENAEKRLQSMTPEVRAAGPHPLGK